MAEEVFVQVRKPSRRTMNVCRQADRLEELWDGLPTEGVDYKLVSLSGLASIGVIRFVAERAAIRRLSVATFRVGPTALKTLCGLHTHGLLEDARFVIGNIQAQDQRKSSAIDMYYDLVRACRRNCWELAVRRNHTKLILFDTDEGRFVLESSSNLNEAPNWEQFSLTQDEALYHFYDKVFDLMFDSPLPVHAEVEPEEAEPVEGLEWGKTGNLIW